MSDYLHPGSPMGDSSGSGSSRRPHSHRAHRAPHPGRSREIGVLVTKVLACAVSVVLLLSFGYGWYEYRSLNNGVQRFHLSGLDAATKAPHLENGHHVDGVEQNILIVGMDSRADLSASERKLLSLGNDNSLSTDTIMVIHVPADGSKATMISIPRDSYVDIPGGYLKNKINAAYADAYADAATTGSEKEHEAAGMDELLATVKQLTGLKINHYVQVGFGGFYKIAQAIGTIPVNLCHATDDTLAHNMATGQGHVGSNFKMSAGKHDLTPVQVVEFVRQRHNLHGGDLAREERQRYFLTAAFNKLKSSLLNPVKLNGLIKAISGAFTIDDNEGFSIPDLAAQMADLSAGHITGYTIPTEGTTTVDIAGVSSSVEIVNPAKVQARIAAILAGTYPPKKPTASGSTSAASGTATSPPPEGTPITSASAPTKKSGCIN
ncbi:MAG TPA: LCP family protein [Jatrophihabitantaceae bacterium]|nr:LCP family protein [Jatrophihabitantaceae bacterium]